MTTEPTPTRRDLVTLLIAALAGLTVGGVAASVAPSESPIDRTYEGVLMLVSDDETPVIERNRLVRLSFNEDGSADLWFASVYRDWRSVPATPETQVALSRDQGRRLRALIEGVR